MTANRPASFDTGVLPWPPIRKYYKFTMGHNGDIISYLIGAKRLKLVIAVMWQGFNVGLACHKLNQAIRKANVVTRYKNC